MLTIVLGALFLISTIGYKESFKKLESAADRAQELSANLGILWYQGIKAIIVLLGAPIVALCFFFS